MGLEHVIKVPLEGGTVTLLPFPSCLWQGIRKRLFSPPFRCWCPTFPVSSSSPSCAFPRWWFKCLSSDGSPLQLQPWSWAKTHRSATCCFRPGVRTPAKPPELRELLRALSSALGLQIHLFADSFYLFVSGLDFCTWHADSHGWFPLHIPPWVSTPHSSGLSQTPVPPVSVGGACTFHTCSGPKPWSPPPLLPFPWTL